MRGRARAWRISGVGQSPGRESPFDVVELSDPLRWLRWRWLNRGPMNVVELAPACAQQAASIDPSFIKLIEASIGVGLKNAA